MLTLYKIKKKNKKKEEARFQMHTDCDFQCGIKVHMDI